MICKRFNEPKAVSVGLRLFLSKNMTHIFRSLVILTLVYLCGCHVSAQTLKIVNDQERFGEWKMADRSCRRVRL